MSENEEEPIYEKLAPGEALILSRIGDEFLVAENISGDIVLKRLVMEK